jgi:hypothetical protein
MLGARCRLNVDTPNPEAAGQALRPSRQGAIHATRFPVCAPIIVAGAICRPEIGALTNRACYRISSRTICPPLSQTVGIRLIAPAPGSALAPIPAYGAAGRF